MSTSYFDSNIGTEHEFISLVKDQAESIINSCNKLLKIPEKEIQDFLDE